jgi:hypothetical protein
MIVQAPQLPAQAPQLPVQAQDAAPAKIETASIASETITPVTAPIAQSAVPVLPAAMVPTNAALPPEAESAAPAAPPGPPLDLSLNDARSFREQGIVAYRNGDLNAALSDFDQAIALDPKYTAAYIDRGIVLYRMRKFERAFADLAHAKKLDHTNKSHVAGAQTALTPPAAVPPGARRPRFGLGGMAFGMMTPRHPMGVE